LCYLVRWYVKKKKKLLSTYARKCESISVMKEALSTKHKFNKRFIIQKLGDIYD